MKVENFNLNIGSWRFLNFSQESKGKVLTFGIDPQSVKNLKTQRYYQKYRFERILISGMKIKELPDGSWMDVKMSSTPRELTTISFTFREPKEVRLIEVKAEISEGWRETSKRWPTIY